MDICEFRCPHCGKYTKVGRNLYKRIRLICTHCKEPLTSIAFSDQVGLYFNALEEKRADDFCDLLAIFLTLLFGTATLLYLAPRGLFQNVLFLLLVLAAVIGCTASTRRHRKRFMEKIRGMPHIRSAA